MRVAHAAVAGPGDQHERRIINRNAFGRDDGAQLIGDLRQADGFQLEDL